MKVQRIQQKLTLNKKTISDLNRGELLEIKGGIPPSFPDTCGSICPSEIFCCVPDTHIINCKNY